MKSVKAFLALCLLWYGSQLPGFSQGDQVPGWTAGPNAFSYHHRSRVSDSMDGGTVAVVADSNVPLSGLGPIDGYTLTDGELVLLIGQTDGRQNGPWRVTAGGWVRPSDYSIEGRVDSGRCIYVERGDEYGTCTYQLITDTPLGVCLQVDEVPTIWRKKDNRTVACVECWEIPGVGTRMYEVCETNEEPAQFALDTETSGTAALQISGATIGWSMTNTGQAATPTSGLSDGGEIFYIFDGPAGWDLSSTLQITGVPSGVDVKLRLYGKIDSAANAQLLNEFKNYTISWVGGAGSATLTDPQGQIVGGDQAIANGGSFQQTGSLNNNATRWYVDIPVGATQFTLSAEDGRLLEGLRFSAVECLTKCEKREAFEIIKGDDTTYLDTETDAVVDFSDPDFTICSPLIPGEPESSFCVVRYTDGTLAVYDKSDLTLPPLDALPKGAIECGSNEVPAPAVACIECWEIPGSGDCETNSLEVWSNGEFAGALGESATLGQFIKPTAEGRGILQDMLASCPAGSGIRISGDGIDVKFLVDHLFFDAGSGLFKIDETLAPNPCNWFSWITPGTTENIPAGSQFECLELTPAAASASYCVVRYADGTLAAFDKSDLTLPPAYTLPAGAVQVPCYDGFSDIAFSGDYNDLINTPAPTETHPPATFTNTAAPWSWDVVTQSGNVPLVSSMAFDAASGEITHTAGDGTEFSWTPAEDELDWYRRDTLTSAASEDMGTTRPQSITEDIYREGSVHIGQGLHAPAELVISGPDGSASGANIVSPADRNAYLGFVTDGGSGATPSYRASLYLDQVGHNTMRWRVYDQPGGTPTLTGTVGVENVNGVGGDVFEFDSADAQFHKYPNTRDDTATEPQLNVLYTDAVGELQSAPFAPSNQVAMLSVAGQTNLNTGPATDFVFNAGSVATPTPAAFTATAAGLQVTDAGWYLVSFNAKYTSGAQRASVRTVLTVNGTEAGPDATSGYIRALNGHNAGSAHLADYLVQLNAGDVIGMHGQREANAGTVAIAANQGTLTIELKSR